MLTFNLGKFILPVLPTVRSVAARNVTPLSSDANTRHALDKAKINFKPATRKF